MAGNNKMTDGVVASSCAGGCFFNGDARTEKDRRSKRTGC